MSIEVIESAGNGAYTTMPDPGDTPASSGEGQDAAAIPQTDVPAVPGESAPPAVPAPGEERLAAAPEPGEADDDEPLRDDSEVNAERLNRRFARLTAARRKAERQVEEQRQQHQAELAHTRGQLDALQRVMSGAAPAMPETPAQPTGPPSAEQYASHEDFVHAAAMYATDQRMQQERQQQQQLRFQQDLMSREQDFKSQHPDFDAVVRGGLAGKVSPVLQQALMLVPDGPAVAYRLAQMPDLVHRLNGLPPPLVLVELGRLAPPPQATTATPAVGSTNGTTQPPAVSAPPLPEPMAPVGGGGSMVQPTFSENMSQREYEQWRARTSQIPYVRRS